METAVRHLHEIRVRSWNESAAIAPHGLTPSDNSFLNSKLDVFRDQEQSDCEVLAAQTARGEYALCPKQLHFMKNHALPAMTAPGAFIPRNLILHFPLLDG
jgi:hypothetical protein